MKAAGAGSALPGALAFFAITWIGLFTVIGAAILCSVSIAPRQWLVLSPVELLFQVPAFAAAPFIAVCLTKSSTGRLPGRIALATLLGLAVTGSIESIVIMGGIPLPLIGLFRVGFHILYSSIAAVQLYLLLWALRSACSIALQLLLGPDRDLALLNLELGLVGASVAAGFSTGIAVLAGANPWLVHLDWFYVMAMPALIGFGLSTPAPRRPSILFALAAAALAVCVGWAAIPVAGQRHGIACNPFSSGGEHEVFYRTKEPWRWRQPKNLREWLIAPVAVSELTFWHVVDPVTEADCPGS